MKDSPILKKKESSFTNAGVPEYVEAEAQLELIDMQQSYNLRESQQRSFTKD